VADVASEKSQKALLEGVEAFDASKLKHTETQEKNPLPDKDGKFFILYNNCHVALLFNSCLCPFHETPAHHSHFLHLFVDVCGQSGIIKAEK